MFLSTRNPSVCKITRSSPICSVLSDGKFYTFNNGECSLFTQTGYLSTLNGCHYFQSNNGSGISYTPVSQISGSLNNAMMTRAGQLTYWSTNVGAYISSFGYGLGLNAVYGNPLTGLLTLTQNIYNDTASAVTPKLYFPTNQAQSLNVLSIGGGGINIDFFGRRAFSLTSSSSQVYNCIAFSGDTIQPGQICSSVITVCSTGVEYTLIGSMILNLCV